MLNKKTPFKINRTDLVNNQSLRNEKNIQSFFKDF